MAYAMPLTIECYAQACNKRAVMSVYNRWNARQGDFCAKHGNCRLKALDQAEKDLDDLAKQESGR